MTNDKKNNAYQQNISTVLAYLYRHSHTSRTEISQETGLTPATISHIIKDLEEQGVLYETGDEVSEITGSGRRRKIITLRKDNPTLVGGIELNAKGIFFVITNLFGDVVLQKEVLNRHYSPNEINQMLVKEIQQLMAQIDTQHFLGFGLAVAGHYDKNQGTIITNNPHWRAFNLFEIKKEIPYPLIVKNNIDCMALGTYLFDAEHSPSRFTLLHVGLGMYCAFFAEERLGLSKSPYIGEIGHMVVELNGQQCECGKKGCLQTYISESWLINKARFLFENSPYTHLRSLVQQADEIQLKHLLTAYELNEPVIKSQIDKGIDLLTMSIANTFLLHRADKIYLNSELLNSPLFSQQILDKVREQLHFIDQERNIQMEVLPFNPYRGAIGACALASLAYFVRHKNLI